MTLSVVIPARMGSTRFPGKPLVDLCGKPMVQWVWEAARAALPSAEVVVATPDEQIVQACEKFGARAVMTSHEHPTGTDRIAEVARSLLTDGYLNVQGDEPLIQTQTIQACAAALAQDGVEMSSVYGDCPADELDNPAAVKVVCDREDFALYFSRYPIPYPRAERQVPVRKHVGVYGYRRDALLRFAEWRPSPLEVTETLEQLRFMENRVRIKMARGAVTPVAVDTPDQASQVRALLEKGRIRLP